MFELSLMLNTAGLYWFGVALVWFGLIREGSYELHECAELETFHQPTPNQCGGCIAYQ
ncbi:hypothetical protein T4B_2623 [Trichinella pseudospiralis]|uniref:Uncharacterized protein n=2 Tax=Trichinella pseudospiralis TaxID=6337 RepID=A0A0V1HZG4_TRIPS|nr:hypothetical protein T4A_2961 [Trichinella pseudospiralis]KRY81641.1 hypothetical protein T4D_6517 [Trichinella pseudospiralis]KRZ15458.1 hypothetical protein T4B_2623 [Trichinella pseudospiralis]